MRKLTSKELVIASHNAGKLREISAMIAPFGITAKSAAELDLPEPEETGTTFKENAALKALSAVRETGIPSLADDSGLCIEALDGAPGVYTADWAEKADGSGRDFAMAMEKVEQELQKAGAKTAAERRAKFVATLCLAWPDEHLEYFVGEVHGQLVWPPRGTLGFGFDPVFQPDGFEQTFGEMTSEEKHGWDASNPKEGLSHRARSFSLFARTCLDGDDAS